MLDLEAIKKRAESATPGPWVVSPNNISIAVFNHEKYENRRDWQGPAFWHDQVCSGWLVDTNDAEFIAHAREDIPALISEVEKLQAENRELIKKCGMLRKRLSETEMGVD